ncbi:hypothetical protein GCM10010271_06050 [Streptomyces kurssanovii]|nr:hypothetical protein GCM10010271_06050 [Streptomyces kurssanovii]
MPLRTYAGNGTRPDVRRQRHASGRTPATARAPAGGRGAWRDTCGYFMPDVLIESTICRWKVKNSASIGRAATVAAARM